MAANKTANLKCGCDHSLDLLKAAMNALKNVSRARRSTHRANPGGMLGGGGWGKSRDCAVVEIVSVLVTVLPTTPVGTTDGGFQKHADPMGIPGNAGGQLKSTGELNPFMGETDTV